MTTQIINIWQIYCITESVFVSGPLFNGQNCTTCFHNTSHTVNPDSVSLLYNINPNTTIISTQDPGQTNGNYKCIRKIINIPSGTIGQITSQVTKFNYPVGLLSFNIDVNIINIGDMFECVIMPAINGGIIGLSTININAGDKIISIPSSVIGYFSIGYIPVFINSSTGFREEETEIISININNGTITLAVGVSSSFPSGSYISFITKKIETYYMNSVANRDVGNFLRSALLPISAKAELRYTNNSTTAKTFVYGVNMLY